MPYRIAAIDVHKKMLAVVTADIAVEGEYDFERRQFSTSPDQLRALTEWLVEQKIQEVVMESTAQYWRPVWQTLEQYWKAECQKWEGAGPMSGTLHLAQAQSNRGPRGRKKDFVDAERLLKRLVAQELIMSFVPDAEQRLWRTVVRRKYQLTCDRVRLQNQLESLLEEAQLKLSSLVSDLLGASARRMLKALADGETSPSSTGGAGRSATARHPATVVRRTRRFERTQSGVSSTAEDGPRRAAINRTADGPTGPRDCESAEPLSGCGAATGRGPRTRSEFGTADHRRSGRRSGDIPFREAPRLVGWSMPRTRRERGSFRQQPVSER